MPLIQVASALSFASGAMDVSSFTRLGGVFSSVMTGNLVLLGLGVERASTDLASHAATAIAGYILGVAVASRVCGDAPNPQTLWPRRVTATLIVELGALGVLALGWGAYSGHPGGKQQFPLLIAAGIAMGLQSEAMRNVGTAVSTTYLTGTLTSTVASLVKRRSGTGKDRLNLVVLASVAIGAACGAGVISLVPTAAPLLPLVAVGFVVTVASVVGVHE